MMATRRSSGRDLGAVIASAVERERCRMADELHDSVIQELVLACMLIDDARLNRSCSRLERARSLLKDSLEQLRSMVSAQTPALVHRVGLCEAIEWLSQHLGRRWGLAYRCRLSGEPGPLPGAMADVLFQGIRELMTNAGRHARASRCDVIVEIGDTFLEVTVSDDGIGIEPEHTAARLTGVDGGFGLFSLRSRIEDLGGELQLRPRDGGGTRATLRLPLSGRGSDEG